MRQTHMSQGPALRIVDFLGPRDAEESLREDLSHRRLPDRHLYAGDGGATRWLDLDQSPSFSIASDLTALLRKNASRIVNLVPPDASLIGMGVGGGLKESILMDILSRKDHSTYLAADVSPALVKRALDAVADLNCDALGAIATIDQLPELLALVRSPILLTLLGNTFSNFEAQQLFSLIRPPLKSTDLFLFDAHIVPDEPERESHWRREVRKSYTSAMNTQFNLAPLTTRGVSPHDCTFSLELIRERTPFGETWRTRKTIEILKDTEVRFETGPIRLHQGEVIDMGFTFKHTRGQVLQRLQGAGFEAISVMSDQAATNLLVLACLA